jgi:hypothetical protein
MRRWFQKEDGTKELLELILKEIRHMSTGLTNLQAVDAALAQAITDNTTATNAAVADISSLVAQLAGINTEDPAVAAIAADLQTKVTALEASTSALTAAVTPVVTPPAPPTTSPSA